ANAVPLQIGARNGANFLNGFVDDVRIYNRALSASEVRALYNGNQNTGSGTYTLGSALTVAGNLNIVSGALDTSGVPPMKVLPLFDAERVE
ncbi:MAG: hypothetical protein H0U19_14405, partial [Acidobacteria bacterium]|nr:hypothetical protein [Acidobacteriota bacterium]